MGTKGFPAAPTFAANDLTNSITVSATGVILATPKAVNGVKAAETYTLTPTPDATGRISWTKAATGCADPARASGPIC
jgi:hypothetical protein